MEKIDDLSQSSDGSRQNGQFSFGIKSASHGEYNLIAGPTITDYNKYYSLKICKDNASDSCSIYYISPLHQYLSLDGLSDGKYNVYVELCDYRTPASCNDLGILGQVMQKPLSSKEIQILINENFENNNKAFNLGVALYQSIDRFEKNLQSCQLSDELQRRIQTTTNILNALNLLREKDTGWEWVRFVHDYDLLSLSLHQISVLSEDTSELGLAPTAMSRILGFWDTSTAVFKNKVTEPSASIPVSYHRYILPGKRGEILANYTLGHVTHGAVLIGRKNDLFVKQVLDAKRPTDEIKKAIEDGIPKQVKKDYPKVVVDELKKEDLKIDVSEEKIEVVTIQRKDPIKTAIKKYYRDIYPLKIDQYIERTIRRVTYKETRRFILKEPVNKFIEGKQKAFYVGWAGRPDGIGQAQGWWADTQRVYVNKEITENNIVSEITGKDFDDFRNWYTTSGYYSQKNELEEVIFAVRSKIYSYNDDLKNPDFSQKALEFKNENGISLKLDLEQRLDKLISIRSDVAKKELTRSDLAKMEGKETPREKYVFLTHNCSTVSGICLNKALKTNMFTQLGPIDTPKNLDLLTDIYKQVQSFQASLFKISDYFNDLYKNSQVLGLGLVEETPKELPLKFYAMNQYENLVSLLTVELEFWEQKKSEGNEVLCVLNSFSGFEDEFQHFVSEFNPILENRLNLRNEIMLLEAN